MTAAQALLVRLAAADERCLRETVSAVTGPRPGDRGATAGLDRRSRSLVRLAAILAVGAPRESVCWAAEQASACGAGDDELAAVLLVVGPCALAAGSAVAAPRLAAALGEARRSPEWPAPG